MANNKQTHKSKTKQIRKHKQRAIAENQTRMSGREGGRRWVGAEGSSIYWEFLIMFIHVYFLQRDAVNAADVFTAASRRNVVEFLVILLHNTRQNTTQE